MTQVGCKWMSVHLDEYLSGGCTEEERESAELHLAICIDCSENVKMWSFLQEEVPHAPLPPLPPMVERRIFSGRGDESVQGLSPRRYRSPVASVGTAVGVAVALVVISLSLVQSKSSDFQSKSSDFQSKSSEHTSVAPPVRPFLENATSVATGEAPENLRSMDFRIDPSGKHAIDVYPGTTLWLDDDAAVVVEALDETQARFCLVRGLAVAEIGPVPPGFRFVVETNEQEIEARGTVFAVQVDASGTSSVRVAEGTVEVRRPHRLTQAQIMTGGQSLAPSADAPVAAEAGELASDMAFIDTDERPSALAGTTPPETPESAEPVAPAVSEDALEARRADARRPKTSPDTSLEQGPAQLLDLAQEFRRSGAYGPAAAAYEKIIAAYPDSASAAISLVSLGQLRLTVLENPTEALALFERYLTALPHGTLRAAALSGKVRSLARLKRYDEVIDNVTAYLFEYPGSGATPEMLRRRGDASLALGRSDDAVHDYTQVIARWPDSAEAVRARKSLADRGVSP